jgi:PGAP1-like protein
MLRRRRNGSPESHHDDELHKSSDEPVKNDEDETTTGISFSSSGCGVLVGCTPHDGANYDKNGDTALLSNRRRSIGFGFVLVFGCRFAVTILHVAACLFYAFGVHQAQTRLYTHEECDMTYSRRQFIQLQLNDDDATRRSSLPWRDGKMLQDVEMEETEETSSTTNDYRLFKFFDQRDPRHVQFLNVPEEQALTGNAWCTNTSNRTMVVYVPGHAGSFQQSRSLGAHGLGLTSRLHGAREQKIVQALGASLMGQDAAALDDINHFVYDVYALDFREQGSGLHGALLEEQARFLVRCIHHLATSCRQQQQQHVSSSSICIVAHSIGGIVSRLAMKRHGHIMKASGVHSIITLGTPHAHPIVAWDSSIHSIYQELSTASTAAAAETDDNSDIDVLLISISGGLRDEMIPPTSCIIRRNDHDSMMRSSDNSLTLLGPQHMVAGTVAPSLGMDHRAIVWCHNLLSTVRSILFILAKTEYQQQPQQHYSTPRERLDRVKAHLKISIKENGSDEYLVSVQDMRRTLRVRLIERLFAEVCNVIAQR